MIKGSHHLLLCVFSYLLILADWGVCHSSNNQDTSDHMVKSPAISAAIDNLMSLEHLDSSQLEQLNLLAVEDLNMKNYTRALACFKRAANGGVILARFNLGSMYLLGDGVEQNLEKAQKWFSRADLSNDPIYPYLFGVELCKRGNYKEAIPFFEQARSRGNPDAQQCVADAQRDLGLDAFRDKRYSDALEWFEKSRANGHSGMQTLIGKVKYAIAMVHAEKEDVPETLRWMTAAAEENNPNAQHALGLKCKHIDNLEGHTEALRWFKLARKNGSCDEEDYIAECYYNIGVIEYMSGNYSEALASLKKAAKRDHLSSLYNVGVLYLKGQGVLQSEGEALSWFEKARLAGNKDAQPVILTGKIGLTYCEMNKYDRALHWLQKAVEFNDPDAMFCIGIMYLKGQGASQSEEEGLAWLEKAKAAGHKDAQQGVLERQIGLAYCDMKNYERALHWFQKAVEFNDPDAMLCIGLMYQNGHGVEQDFFMSLEWSQKAVKNGCSEASEAVASNMFNIGLCFRKQNNNVEALNWFYKAYSLGHVNAAYNIAVIFQNGDGVEENQFEALKWYKNVRRSEQRDVQAEIATVQSNIAIAYLDAENFAEAFLWNTKAAKKGNPEAQYNLAIMYMDGEGIEVDKKQALLWFEKALSSGFTEAAEAIATIRSENEDSLE